MAISGSRQKCALVLPGTKDAAPLRSILSAACRDAGIDVVDVGRNEQLGARLASGAPDDEIIQSLSQAGLVIADISENSFVVSYSLGIASAFGKPVIRLINEDNARAGSHFAPGAAFVIPYSNTESGLRRLRLVLRDLLETFRRFPSRFRTRALGGVAADRLFVDLDRLDLRARENLLFELLTQLGFRRVNWGKELREVDVVATLPRRDPDGFQYEELWLIATGQHMPMNFFFEMALGSPERLVERLFRGASYERLRGFQREDTRITILLVMLEDHPMQEAFELELRHAERRARGKGISLTPRIRIWDRQHLTALIQQHPQLANKYFAEDGGAQSRHRKSPEELYNENVLLLEQKQATLAALNEEKDKRVRAERDAVWKDLAFTAAHKLGNPVFALETDLQGLRKRLPEGAVEAKAITEEMDASVEKAKTIIQHFKSFTKAQEIRPQAMDVLPLLHTACRVAAEQGTIVEVQAPKKGLQIFGDPARLSEAFDELVANALHWMDKPTKQMSVELNRLPKREIPAGLAVDRKYARIRFTDNGSGVPSENKEKIFSPFFTTYPHGTGLGLALVQRIAEGHGGRIVEDGVPGEGARFDIILPLAESNHAKGDVGAKNPTRRRRS